MNIKRLVSELKKFYTWTNMKHATRFNGVVDLFHNGYTVHVLPTNEYQNFHDKSDMENFILKALREHQKRTDFARKDKKVSFKDFQNEKFKRLNCITTSKAEDYHWNLHKDKASEQHLYFLVHDDCVKIGKSKDVQKRLRSLKTSLAKDYKCFVVPNKGFLEKDLHRCFSQHKSRSNSEWFKSDMNISVFVKKRLDEGTAYRFC